MFPSSVFFRVFTEANQNRNEWNDILGLSRVRSLPGLVRVASYNLGGLLTFDFYVAFSHKCRVPSTINRRQHATEMVNIS